MTKKFEEFIRGTVEEIKNTFNERTPKGEFVLSSVAPSYQNHLVLILLNNKNYL